MTKEQCTLVMDQEVRKFIEKMATYSGKKHPSIGKDEFISIGNEAACVYSMDYDKTSGVPFLLYIRKFIVLKMVMRIREDVYGIHRENNEYVCTDVQMIEEMKFSRDETDKENKVSNEEKLSWMVENLDDERRAKWERLEPLIGCLTEEERELILIRFGFLDNHGEAMREYMKKHNIKKTVFYERAEVVVQKMRTLASKEIDY